MSKERYKFKPIKRDEAKTLMENSIMHHTAQLIRAGLSVALGTIVVFKTVGGTPTRVTDEEELDFAFSQMSTEGKSQDGKYFFVSTKDPDINAIDKLLSRAYGKPVEKHDVDVEVNFLETFRMLGQRALAKKDDTIVIQGGEVMTDDKQKELETP